MGERFFPIQESPKWKGPPHPTRVPWIVAEIAYRTYSDFYGDEQSLDCLAERGGFYSLEMDDFFPDWLKLCGELYRLIGTVAKLEEQARLIDEGGSDG